LQAPYRPKDPSGHFDTSWSQPQLGACFTELLLYVSAYAVHCETLFRPTEDLLKLAALKILDESRLCIEVGATSARDAGYEQVFLVRNAVLLIVDHFTVSIEREPEFDVAPDAKDGDRFALRRDGRELFSQRAAE